MLWGQPWNFKQGAWETSLSRWLPEGAERENHADTWDNNVQGPGHSKCKCLEVGVCLVGGASLLLLFSALLISPLNPMAFFFLLTFGLHSHQVLIFSFLIYIFQTINFPPSTFLAEHNLWNMVYHCDSFLNIF